MNRRVFLSLALASGIGAWLLPSLLQAEKRREMTNRLLWQNWSGALSAAPKKRLAPHDEKELIALLKKSSHDVPLPIRPVGSGHSFSPLVPGEGSLLSLDLMESSPSVYGDQARLAAGAKLFHLTRQLAARDLAFRNLPDINKQSLAGATATATHGTGLQFGSLSSEISHIRLISAQGDVIQASAKGNSDVFLAAKTSLGVLGIITEIVMRVQPIYRLHRRTWFEPYHSLLSRAMSLFQRHRNFEFYYIPFTDYCLAISHDETTQASTIRQDSEEDEGLMELKFLRDWLSWSTSLRRRLGRSAIAEAPTENTIGRSDELLSSTREIRFNEMEYHLPADQGLQALDEIKDHIERNHTDTFFPIECRYVRREDGWLSPFQKEDKISIAVHAYYKDAYQPLFKDIEPIFRRHHGRPHWGKMNYLNGRDFAELYPDWEKFRQLRQKLDLKGKWLNPYLKGLFDE